MQLSLNGASSLPLIDQIVSGTRALIDDRVLRPGMRVPPIRSFAETHGISRFTVVEAYDRLTGIVVRLLPPGREIKLGVLTSLLGAPLFIWLLWKARRQWI